MPASCHRSPPKAVREPPLTGGRNVPRSPERTILFRTLADELETFLTRRDGTTHVVFEPGDLVARLAALVPPRRFHRVRYHGVVAPMAAWRPRIVPQVGVLEERRPSQTAGPQVSAPPPGATTRPRDHSWAELMLRVFAQDVLERRRCRSPLRILAQIHPPDTTRAILACLGLSARPPPIAPARRVPEDVLLPGCAPELEDDGR